MTPEEQVRIRTEEVAREQIRAEFRTRRTRKILLGCALALAGIIALPFVIMFGIAFLYGFFGAVSPSQNPETPAYVPPESILGPITNGKPGKPVVASWKAVASWKGDSTKNTESFRVSSGEWRIKWKSGGSFFSIMVYDANRDLVTVAATTASSGSDISYVRAPRGTFYLEIICAGFPWEVVVEQK